MNSLRDSVDPVHSRREQRASSPEDRYELDRFKRDIDLSAFAASRGYELDRRESSASCRVMRHRQTNDKIIIGKAKDGHWQYFSVRDRDDNGSIVDFVQHRDRASLGEVRRELREWTHTERPLPAFTLKPIEPVTKDRAAVALAIARAALVESHPYLESRGLTRETLSSPRFRGTWREGDSAYRNVLFLHHDAQGLCGFEIKNAGGFTGFAKGGEKGLWSSVTTPRDSRLVVSESAIDALSYHQVNPHPRTRYVSFAGQLNERQPALIVQAISWLPPGSTVVAATDKDRDGGQFALRIQGICAQAPHVRFERHAPTLGKKDWNDHLQALELGRSLAREPKHRHGLER